MKNKKLSAALFALTFGIGLSASTSAFAASCTSLFQACEYHGNMNACDRFEEQC